MVDILTRNAPLFSTTSDGPIVPPPAPPLRASSVAEDNAPEMAPEEQAAATAAKQDGTPTVEEKPQPVEPVVEAKPEEDTAPGEPPPAKDDLPPHIKREITKARNQKREAEERAKAADAKVEQVLKLVAELEKRIPPAPTPSAEPKPTREKFTTPQEFDSALEAWASKEGERKAREALIADAKAKQDKDAREAAEAELAQLNTEWQSNRAKALEAHEDYVDVAEAENLSISEAMAHAILSAGEIGPEVAYYLGKHPDEAKRISGLRNAGVQIFEIGRLAAKLATPAPKPEVPTSKAPAPITPVKGSSASADAADREPTMEEWAAKRTVEIRRERRPFMQVSGNA